MLGDLLLEKENYKEAINAYTQAIKNDLGKKDEAIEMLKILSKQKPELYEPSKMLGDLLLEKESFKEAIYAYTQAIKSDLEKPEAYYKLGIAYARQNEFSFARECFLKTVEKDSNLYNAYYRLGQISLLYRDINEAEQFFLQSIYGETEVKSFYQLAKIYMMKNNKQKAIMFLNKATEISNEFYKKAIEEPIFFSIKNQILKTEEDNNYVESDEEKNISEYLDNTYLLTKVLDEKKKNKNTKRKFNI